MGQYKIDPLVVLGVPTLMDRPLSWAWTDRYMSLSFPLGVSVAKFHPKGHQVAEARNLICEHALENNADYVLMIADDVLAPSRVFEALQLHKKEVVTGMYWTKEYPTKPYIWKDLLRGPYLDWKHGEFFQIDWAGCDCLLIHTDVLKKIKPPWFSLDWTFEEGKPRLPLATEDMYFYTKLRMAGIEVWCDSAVQCEHEDRNTHITYGLTEKMPQYKDSNDGWKWYTDGTLVADVGCGHETPHLGSDIKLVRIDQDPDVKPDILCDIRAIPQIKEMFDVVWSSHVIEHFNTREIQSVIKEMIRILKIDGELVITVPNIAFAAQEILKADQNPNYKSEYAGWQLWGHHVSFEEHEFHRCGFTRHGLLSLLRTIETLKDIEVEVVEDGRDLRARAIKKKTSDPFPIYENWHGLYDANGRKNGKPKETKKKINLKEIKYKNQPPPPKRKSVSISNITKGANETVNNG